MHPIRAALASKNNLALGLLQKEMRRKMGLEAFDFKARARTFGAAKRRRRSTHVIGLNDSNLGLIS